MISKNMVQRLLSAAGLVIISLSVFLTGGLLWQGFLICLALLMAGEWLHIIGNKQPKLWALFLGGVLGGLLFFLPRESTDAQTLPRLIPIIMALLAAVPALISQRRGKCACFLAGGGIVLPLLSIYAIGQQAPLFLLWLVLAVWATDTLAMVFGKTIGGPKLAPTVSPQKTWAGLGGGVLGSLAATGLLWAAAPLPLTLLLWAPLLTILAQGGDLLESALKRRFDVKDSGHLIPGHGGILDRMDGFLLTAPALWFLLQFIAT